MIASANDDGAGGAGGSGEGGRVFYCAGLTLWVIERREGGAIIARPVVVTGEIRLGASAGELTPEQLARCVPLRDPGDDAAGRKEGA
jgi:hypothetical protein